MKLPIIPILIAAVLIGGSFFFYNSKTSGTVVFKPAELHRILDIPGVETETAISPDGKRYAAVVDGDIFVMNSDGSGLERVTQTIDSESFPVWGADGRHLAYSRGSDTWMIPADHIQSETLLKANATSLSMSVSGQMAFVRDRALWLADPTGKNERQVVTPEEDPNVTIRVPRFSPDSTQLAFLKTIPGIRGEVWLLDLANSEARALVSDRGIENPMDVGWIMHGRHLVYLTDRSGAYAIWDVNLAEGLIAPLTTTLDGLPLERIGMAIWNDRIVLPRHFLDSNIAISDGTLVAHSDDPELEPAISPDGKTVAYTVEKDARFEIWTAGIDGSNPSLRTLGRTPTFSPNGHQLAFTHIDLAGNPDIWSVDLRDNSSHTVTDAEELDLQPSWSPVRDQIVFASDRGGPLSIWSVPSDGGKRLRLNDGGYFPRFTADGKAVTYWHQGSLWTMNVDGTHPQIVRGGIPDPAPGIQTASGTTYFRDLGQRIWPQFDVLQDGRTLIAPIEIRETALWAVDLIYTIN